MPFLWLVGFVAPPSSTGTNTVTEGGGGENRPARVCCRMELQLQGVLQCIPNISTSERGVDAASLSLLPPLSLDSNLIGSLTLATEPYKCIACGVYSMKPLFAVSPADNLRRCE